MRITGIDYNINRITFTSCSRTYKKDTKAYPEQTKIDIGLKSAKQTTNGFEMYNLSGTKINYICQNVCTLTEPFRNDINWIDLMGTMNSDYADEDIVNIYSTAGSDGSEGQTFKIAIKEKLPTNQQNKYKIMVSDIDREVIEAAKSGIINLSEKDFERIRANLIDPEKYFHRLGKPLTIANNEEKRFKGYYSYKLIQELLTGIEFAQSDILEVLRKIDKSVMSIFCCRNVMPYLSENYVREIVAKANENLKSRSLFLTGDFDYVTGIESLLLKSNFRKRMRNVYQKI